MATQTAPRRNLWQRVWSVFDPNERYCRSLMPQVQSIAQLEAEFEGLSQQDMQDRLRKIRSLVAAAREAKQAEHDQLPPAEDSFRPLRVLVLN